MIQSKKIKSLDKSQLHPPGTVEAQYRQLEEDLKFYWDKQSDYLDFNRVEKVSCSLCDEPPPEGACVVFLKYRFPYLCCPSCSLIYPSPRPKIQFINEQYKSGRFASTFKEIYLPSAPYRMKTIFRERVEDIILQRVPSGKLLDIGCGSGHFLKVAANCGFEVYGVEPQPQMAAFAETELGLKNIHSGSFEGLEFPGVHFDVITLWDVLEHVPSPHSVLQNVFKRLRPGGWVFAYTENVESFNVFIAKEDSEIFAPDVHLRHYSPKTFRMEFEKAGFKVREVMTRGLDIQHIETTVKVKKGKYPEPELQWMFEMSNELQEVINVCGRGDNLRLFAQKER